MWRITTFIVLLCTVSFGRSFPFATPGVLPVVPPIIPPVVAPVAPIIPAAYPYGPTPTPLVPGVAGYRNPLIPGVAGYRNPLVPGVAGYRNPLVPGVVGYNNPVVPGVAGYNNPYYNAPGVAVPILTYSSEHTGDGSYSFSFSTADGKQAQEAGYLKDAYIDNAGEPQGTQVVQGSYAYISPEGTPIQVSYIADENGFRPSGAHIPADGKAVVPVISDKEKQILDPLYNRYDPFNRNRYNTISKYNRPYDPRYPYDATKYNYNNPYLNNQYLAPGLDNTKDTSKKIA